MLKPLLALAVLVPAAAAGAEAQNIPPWMYLAASVLTSAGFFQLLSWRVNRRVAEAGAEKSEAETADITAEVYDKLKRHVAERLGEMEQQVAVAAAGQAEAQSQLATAQAALATAQASLATALARAAEDRRQLHLQLQEAEERHEEILAEYRRRVGQLERRIAELETALAAAGHTERRRTDRRSSDT
jgi:chromosome segregation ATPase